jgi:hypothetical protein
VIKSKDKERVQSSLGNQNRMNWRGYAGWVRGTGCATLKQSTLQQGRCARMGKWARSENKAEKMVPYVVGSLHKVKTFWIVDAWGMGMRG